MSARKIFTRGGQIRSLRTKVTQRGQRWSTWGPGVAPPPLRLPRRRRLTVKIMHNNSSAECFAVIMHKNTLQHFQGKGKCPLLPMPAGAHAHMGFRLVPTLNDLECRNSPYFAFFSPNSLKFQANYVTVFEDRPIMSVKYCFPVAVFPLLAEIITNPAARSLCDRPR